MFTDTLIRSKETKRTVVYISEQERQMVSTLYVSKEFLTKNASGEYPGFLAITIETQEK